MSIAYADMTDEQRARCDEAIDKFTEWLNAHHEANNETWTNEDGEVVPVRVTKESYFEYDDPPHLLLDTREGETYYRIMVFSLNPYHDEGGPNQMTCYFDDDSRPVWSLLDKGEVVLRHMDQLFDTMIQPVWDEGKFLNGPTIDVTAQVEEGRK